jgi:hypothetical protein
MPLLRLVLPPSPHASAKPKCKVVSEDIDLLLLKDNNNNNQQQNLKKFLEIIKQEMNIKKNY